MKYRGLPENPTADPDLYFPFIDRSQQVSLVIRTASAPAGLIGSVRQVIREVDPGIPVFAVFTMAERIADQTAQSRFTTWVRSARGLRRDRSLVSAESPVPSALRDPSRSHRSDARVEPASLTKRTNRATPALVARRR